MSAGQHSTSEPTRAFTLVELLVAAGITTLLAAFIAGIVMNISSTWSRASTRLGADAQARIVLDQLQLDLQGALFRDDGNVWFAVDVLNGSTGGSTNLWVPAERNPKPSGGLSLQMNPPDLRNARFGTAGVWLRFFTSSRGTNTSTTTLSAPVAVGYQIIRRYTATNSANTATAYLLHRAEVRPTTTGSGSSARLGVLEAGYNITSANYTTSSASTNTGGVTGDPRSIQVPGTNTGNRNLDSVMADNVIDFGVRCYVRDNTETGGLRLIFPADNNGRLTNSATARLRSTLPASTPRSQWGTAQPFPDVVDVLIRVLTDQGAELLANRVEKRENPTVPIPEKYRNRSDEWWWGVAEEHSRVYTRRIVLNSESL